MLGQGVTINMVFKDRNKNPSDPSAIALNIQDPNGNLTTYTCTVAGGLVTNGASPSAFVRDGVGLYHQDLGGLSVHGEWICYCDTTGVLVTSGERVFEVLPSRIVAG